MKAGNQQPTEPGALEPAADPQAEALRRRRAELGGLEGELADRELELATLSAELGAFEVRYRHAFAARYAFLDDLSAQIAEAGARARPWDATAAAEAARARARADHSAWTHARSEREPDRRCRPGERAKRLFRTLARRIHPDLAAEEAEHARRTKLMVTANIAYERGDADTLQRLLDDWENGPDSVVGAGTTAELERVVRKIAQVKARLELVAAELDALEGSFMAALHRQVTEAEAAGWDLLAGMAEELDRQIGLALEELARLTGEAVPLSSPELSG